MKELAPQEQLQKLTLYATVKERLANPEDVIDKGLSFTKLGRLYVKLRKELTAVGLSEEVLNMPGSELTHRITEALLRLQTERLGDEYSLRYGYKLLGNCHRCRKPVYNDKNHYMISAGPVHVTCPGQP